MLLMISMLLIVAISLINYNGNLVIRTARIMEAILSVVIAGLWCISMFCWAAISVAALIDHFKNHK